MREPCIRQDPFLALQLKELTGGLGTMQDEGERENPAQPEKEHCEEQDVDDVIISTAAHLLTH